jgi:hypothetical protein
MCVPHDKRADERRAAGGATIASESMHPTQEEVPVVRRNCRVARSPVNIGMPAIAHFRSESACRSLDTLSRLGPSAIDVNQECRTNRIIAIMMAVMAVAEIAMSARLGALFRSGGVATSTT